MYFNLTDRDALSLRRIPWFPLRRMNAIRVGFVGPAGIHLLRRRPVSDPLRRQRRPISTWRSCAARARTADPAPPLPNTDASQAPTSAPVKGTVRVRFAPSPTGSLHVGGARTALYNWLTARNKGGKFLIRVEDTDVARSTRESEEVVLRDLRWLGLHWDEGPGASGDVGPYRQSERSPIYQRHAHQLIEEGHAYPCFCSKEELEIKKERARAEGRPPQYDGTCRDADKASVDARIAAGEPYSVRFRVPSGSRIVIDDAVRGRVAWDADATVGDFIVLRSSGVPVYNFCVAIDDALMGITDVIRGEEHLTNTLRQVLVLGALGFEIPRYAHCSLINGTDGKKLSKREGAASVNDFREKGFLPDAMINYLATLGWNDGSEKEVFTVEELIDAFKVSRITKSPSMFDIDKLRFVNGQHLRALPLQQLVPLVVSEWRKSGVFNEAIEGNPTLSEAAAEILQGSLELVTDANSEIERVLTYPLTETIASGEADELLAEDGGFVKLAQVVISAYDDGSLPTGQLGDDHAAAWKKWVKGVGKEIGRKGKKLYHPLRLALTGKMSGPDVGALLRVVYLVESCSASDRLVSLDSRIEMLREELRKLS